MFYRPPKSQATLMLKESANSTYFTMHPTLRILMFYSQRLSANDSLMHSGMLTIRGQIMVSHTAAFLQTLCILCSEKPSVVNAQMAVKSCANVPNE